MHKAQLSLPTAAASRYGAAAVESSTSHSSFSPSHQTASSASNEKASLVKQRERAVHIQGESASLTEEKEEGSQQGCEGRAEAAALDSAAAPGRISPASVSPAPLESPVNNNGSNSTSPSHGKPLFFYRSSTNGSDYAEEATATATNCTSAVAAAAQPPLPPSRTPHKGPVTLTSVSAYKTVSVLPPQVFRSGSNNTSVSPSAGGSISIPTEVVPSANSAAPTTLLSPLRQPWYSPPSLSATASAATSRQPSPLMHASTVPPMGNTTGVAMPMSTLVGPFANTLTAPTPVHLSVRKAYQLGGSRKRNSVSVPTHANSCSEDDDSVNPSVSDDRCHGSDQWLMRSQTTSNGGNNAMAGTPGTCHSCSHEPVSTDDSVMTAVMTIKHSAAAFLPPSMRQQNSAEPRATKTVTTVPTRTAGRSAPQAQPSSNNNDGSIAVAAPDHPPISYAPASTMATTTTENASTPRSTGRSVHCSCDSSLVHSLRSPLQSPPVPMAHRVARSGGGALSSRHGSLDSIRLSTHDPYNAAIMVPAEVSRTASLSSLRSPSTNLTSPTVPPPKSAGTAAAAHPHNAKMNATHMSGGNASYIASAESTMLLSPYSRAPSDAIGMQSSLPGTSRGGKDALAFSQFGHNHMNNIKRNSYNDPSEALGYGDQYNHVDGSDNITTARPMADRAATLPLYQQQQQSQLFSYAAPQPGSPLSHCGQPELTSPFSCSTQTSTTLTSPTYLFTPQQQHQQPPTPFLPVTAVHQQPPRRRNAQEALTGFFSEVPIELGDQTHLVLDRNGVPYQDMAASVNGNSSSASNNMNREMSPASSQPLSAPSPPPPAAYAPLPPQECYYYGTEPPSGRVSADAYNPYSPPPPPPPPPFPSSASCPPHGNYHHVTDDLYGSATCCSDMENHASPAAIGSARGARITPLYSSDSAMCSTRMNAARNANNGGGESNSCPTRAFSNNCDNNTSVNAVQLGDAYGNGSKHALASVYSEGDASLRRTNTVGFTTPHPQGAAAGNVQVGGHENIRHSFNSSSNASSLSPSASVVMAPSGAFSPPQQQPPQRQWQWQHPQQQQQPSMKAKMYSPVMHSTSPSFFAPTHQSSPQRQQQRQQQTNSMAQSCPSAATEHLSDASKRVGSTQSRCVSDSVSSSFQYTATDGSMGPSTSV